MKNHTYQFFILTFNTQHNTPFLSFVFILIYLTGVIANSTTITVVYRDRHLHTPMYLFLCNLSIVDLFYTTITIPKLVHMFLSGDYTLSFTQCFVQMYFFYIAVSTEDFLLFIMAYDRYVAICNPLHYHSILSKKNCILFLLLIWISGVINSLLPPLIATNIPLCYSNKISQFFCEYRAISNIFCPNVGIQTFVYTATTVFGLCPFLCSILSYIKIIIVISHIKSSDGRRKAFSTCSSHLIVLCMYYGTWTSAYLIPSVKDTQVVELTLSVLYTTITPMLNPLIYSVRNTDVKRALLKLHLVGSLELDVTELQQKETISMRGNFSDAVQKDQKGIGDEAPTSSNNMSPVGAELEEEDNDAQSMTSQMSGEEEQEQPEQEEGHEEDEADDPETPCHWVTQTPQVFLQGTVFYVTIQALGSHEIAANNVF
ncbi:olfactory receptor 1496-like [Leptodactylus fuscus]|uniref:olfactory receptor 1496-like n=1 Tax=Leptodactylus fuscus TaxID=238119 RepID=UPI003F4E4F4E